MHANSTVFEYQSLIHVKFTPATPLYLLLSTQLLQFMLSQHVLHHVISDAIFILCDDECLTSFSSSTSPKKQPPSPTPLPSIGIQKVSQGEPSGAMCHTLCPRCGWVLGPHYSSVFHEFVESERLQMDCKINYRSS